MHSWSGLLSAEVHSFHTLSPFPTQSFSPTREITEGPSCIDSPYKAKIKVAGDGSIILLSCKAIDVSLDGKTFCQLDGKLASHCPLSCGTCDKELHDDSKARFYDAVAGKIWGCRSPEPYQGKTRETLCQEWWKS